MTSRSPLQFRPLWVLCGRGKTGGGGGGVEKRFDCQREWEYASGRKEQKHAGQALMWQAGNKFSYFRAKSSQLAKHSTASSFISDP
jgi:hypothetical protein